MPIHFLSPNPEQKEALDELEKLIKILEIRPNKKLKRNVRFVKGFTRALLMVGKSRAGKKYSRPEIRIETKIPEAGVKQLGSELEKHTGQKVQENQFSRIPPLPPLPPLPPPVPARSAQVASLGINIKGGGKSFESFVQKVSKENGTLKFNIIEPGMELMDWKIFSYVKAKLKQQIIRDPIVLEREDFLMEEIKDACQKLNIKYSDSYLRKIKYYLIKYIKGFGKIDPLIKDPDISEIICNSYNSINVKYKNELIPTNIQFDTNEELDNLILNMAEKSNKEVSEANPELAVVLQNLKISAFYNPIMGSRFTIAKQ